MKYRIEFEQDKDGMVHVTTNLKAHVVSDDEVYAVQTCMETLQFISKKREDQLALMKGLN